MHGLSVKASMVMTKQRIHYFEYIYFSIRFIYFTEFEIAKTDDRKYGNRKNTEESCILFIYIKID